MRRRQGVRRQRNTSASDRRICERSAELLSRSACAAIFPAMNKAQHATSAAAPQAAMATGLDSTVVLSNADAGTWQIVPP